MGPGSADAELGNFARLAFCLVADLVGGAPAQLDRFDPTLAVAGVPDCHLLFNTILLLGGQGAARLGLKLQLVVLSEAISKEDFTPLQSPPLSPRAKRKIAKWEM